MQANNSVPGVQRRQSFVVDKKWQGTVTTRLILSAMVAVALVQLLAIHFLANGDMMDMSSAEWGLAALLISGLQMVAIFVALWRSTMRITHSVAGPAWVIEQAVDAMREGKYDSRLTLRDGDYLESLAAAVKRLSDHLAAQQRDGTSAAAPPLPVEPEAAESGHTR